MRRNRFVFFLCLLLIGLASCATQTTIVNSISEREANEIVVLLASKGVDAAKTPTAVTTTGGTTTEQMWNIAVPAKQITESLAILNQAGLPRVRGTTLLDLFGTTGLVPSELQDRIRYQEGLSEQLANTIRKMDGIIDAEVQITLPQDDDDETTLTASIYVKHHGVLDNPNSLLVSKIKRLISSAYPGLTVDNVSVVTDRALLSDITLQSFDSPEATKEYISIWKVVVAKESAGRFRMIFYAFCVLIFLLVSSLAWLLWKFFPLFEVHGGIKALFLPRQFKPGATVEEKPEEEGGEE